MSLWPPNIMPIWPSLLHLLMPMSKDIKRDNARLKYRVFMIMARSLL